MKYVTNSRIMKIANFPLGVKYFFSVRKVVSMPTIIKYLQFCSLVFGGIT